MGNRVIKFRGKRVDNGEWVYGGYDTDFGLPVDKRERHWINQAYYGEILVNPETVGQYTGLKDKNDVEIYEGDIIQEFAGEHAQGVWEYSNISVIEDLRWIPESLGFADCTYIIGNIHDNPELIKEKK